MPSLSLELCGTGKRRPLKAVLGVVGHRLGRQAAGVPDWHTTPLVGGFVFFGCSAFFLLTNMYFIIESGENLLCSTVFEVQKFGDNPKNMVPERKTGGHDRSMDKSKQARDVSCG